MGDIVKRTRNGRTSYLLRWYEGGKRRTLASRQQSFAEARRMLQAIEGRVAQRRAGIEAPAAPIDLTMAELCDRFLDEYGHPRIKDLEKYRRTARYSLKPALLLIGSKKAAQLERADVERLRNSLGKKYRPNTVLAIVRPLWTALKWAIDQGLIEKNPARAVALPRRVYRLEYLSQKEAAQLLAEAERQARRGSAKEWSRWAAVSLGLYAGLRRGEALGLRWSDVELDAGRLNIAHSFSALPKSGKPRYLPLPRALVSLLGEWRSLCPKTAEGVVCPVLCSGTWRAARKEPRGMRELYRDAGLRIPAAPWHCLRHSFASTFVMNGGSLPALQKLLGHADLATTQIYAHLSNDFLTEQIDRVKFQ